MASEGRRKPAGLTEAFLRQPDRFEFFQAVRLLEYGNYRRADMGDGSWVEPQTIKGSRNSDRAFRVPT